MELVKSIDSLTWSGDSRPLCEVLEKYRVPNLVRIKEKHDGINDACTFEASQILLLHEFRTKQNFIGKDSVGRPIAIPVRYKRSLLVCPSSINCGRDPIFVSQMSNVYPNVKFFRVIQNTQNEGEARFFQLGSIAEVDHIDETNFEVKFKDVEHPLPFSCGIAFEALLDYRVYKLKDAVKAFGLPIKVRFLSSGNDKNKLDDELENDLENVGKVTISRKSTCKLEAFASSIDSDALTFPKSPVKCSLISKESKLSVYVAQRILVKDLPFRRMLRHYNSEFHDKYDLKELDKFDKCQYLDRPDGDPTPEIIGFILEAKISDENDTTPGTPVPSAPTAQTCDPSSQNGKESSPKNNKDCEVIDQVTDTGEYHDGILKINEIDDYESPTDDHVYESVSDKDMPCGDHVYESVSDEDMSCDDQYYEPAEPKRTVHTGDNKCVLQ